MSHRLIYQGKVRHRRYLEKKHEFTYSTWMFLFDIDAIDEAFSRVPFVSNEKFNWYSYRRRHYFAHPNHTLSQAVRDHVAKKTGLRPEGKIYLLTQLACFGYAFNPISIYFIKCPDSDALDQLVVEVTNTPWHERKLYILDKAAVSRGAVRKYLFKKEMHVSPFMGMNYDYEFNVKFDSNDIIIHMNSYQDKHKHFDATLSLRARHHDVSAFTLLRLSPFVTMKVTLAIYWQAFKLWCKGVSFHAHPGTRDL